MNYLFIEPQCDKAIWRSNRKETDITIKINLWDLIEKVTINDEPIDFKNNINNLKEFY